MRTLVTGGAGFIGSALVGRLLAEGHTVDVVDDLSSGTIASLAGARAAAERRMTFHQLDIRRPDIVALTARRRPEVVFHLAASGRGDAGTDPLRDGEIDIIGSLQVLEASRRCQATKVVFASAAAVYGDVEPSDLPVREGRPERPCSPLGAAKRAVGDYLRVYRDRYSLEFSALVLANVYGPGDGAAQVAGRGRAGVVGSLARVLVGGGGATIDGDGNQTRDFVFVDDVVDALARAAGRGGGLMINVGTGIETSVNDLYGTMAAAAGGRGPATHRDARPGERRCVALDPSRAAIHLGWKPWTTLTEGIDATLDWWRSRAGSS